MNGLFMFAIIESGVYDSVESVYGCLNYGKFYCKYDSREYHEITSDDEKNYLMNHFNQIHEMIHVTDDWIEVIYHDRGNDYFVSLNVDPDTFDPEKHMQEIRTIIDSLEKLI